MRKSLLLMVPLLALVPALAAAQPAPPPPPVGPAIPPSGTRLDVSAEGQVTRVPDLAVIAAGVVTQAKTASAAMAQNADRMAATAAALRRAGVADRDIQTASISLSPQYRYVENQPPELTGYQASNQLSVRFRDIRRSGAILDALVAAGANQINGPTLTVDKPEAALDEARTAAIGTARARAELYARAAGLRVVRIVSISEQGAAPPPTPMPVMMMARAKSQSADTAVEPGEQTLTVTVNVTFELG